MRLEFDHAAHEYRLGGEVLPSVTQVLDDNRMTPDFSRMDPFYRVRGQAIHRAMALHCYGRLDFDSLDEHVRPFVENGARFLDEIGAEPLVVEHRAADPVLRYAGTLDTFCRSKLGPLVIDWKAVICEPAYLTQVGGGYWPLLRLSAQEGEVPVELGEVLAARACVVSLKPKMPKPAWVEDIDAEVETFRAALRMTHWRRANPVKEVYAA